MNGTAAGLVITVAVAICLKSLAALGAANKTDPRFVWPKNSQFNCSGVLAREEGTYRLTPDQGMLTWCDADIGDKDIGRVLDACKQGDRCEIKGIIRGHGAFGWVKITSVKGLFAAANAQVGPPYLGVWIIAADATEDRFDCKVSDWDRRDNDGLIRVNRRVVEHWETACQITSFRIVKPQSSPEGVAEVVQACGGEGMTWRTRELWSTQNIGTRKTMIVVQLQRSQMRDDTKKRASGMVSDPSVSVYLQCYGG